MEEQIFKPQKNEKLTPNKNDHTVLTYIEANQRELKKEQRKMTEKPYTKLIKNKGASMKELIERENIITIADKSDTVVLVAVKDYIKEAVRQLSNTNNYRKLRQDPTATDMKLVNDTIQRLKKTKNK